MFIYMLTRIFSMRHINNPLTRACFVFLRFIIFISIKYYIGYEIEILLICKFILMDVDEHWMFVVASHI